VHSVIADPGFINPGIFDFRIKTGSLFAKPNLKSLITPLPEYTDRMNEKHWPPLILPSQKCSMKRYWPMKTYNERMKRQSLLKFISKIG